MDILVRANISEDPRNRLSEEELLAEMRTVIAAGHLTTGNSLCFILYELARHPDVQERVHAEVSSMLSAVSARGDAEYTMGDLDGMHYILAVLKEALRLHPVVFGPFLYSTIDDVLPLSKPIRTTDGKLLSELPISAGQNVHISISGITGKNTLGQQLFILIGSRLKDIWGPDAHEFRPTRFLDGSVAVKNNFGVFAGLGNFASGGVSCLGWRFAIIEMQTFLVEIMRQFELSLPPADQPEKGMQLPLMVATLP
ncbi:hypothetical protein A0H81_00288 [Grifola frondosa]|uniref:Cytochrome P450 n=1 Tax=Grifola frondosa TaxID=5627 RepID=A0A1C7MQG9_GRIFR|nr:hypothetical protein A0H81_00288 [Grifola frondosa]